MVNLALSVLSLCLVFNIFNVRAGFANKRTSLMAERLESKFDYFAFTQAWPKTFCLNAERENRMCNKTLHLAGWTIHGLWPSGRNGDEPHYCRGKMFSLLMLQPLMGDLLKYWPNLLPNTRKERLWKHEWNKHGTCAVSDKQTRNEFYFFGQALKLFKKYDVTGALRTLNVVPSDTKKYDIGTISKGLTQHFKGIKPIISCLNINDVNYLDQIMICFNKQFKMVDCLERRLTFTGYETSNTKIQATNLKIEMSEPSKNDDTKIDSNFLRDVYEMNGFEATDLLTDTYIKHCHKFVSYPTLQG